MFDQEDAVVDAHAEQQHQREDVEQLQWLAEQPQQRQCQCAGDQGRGEHAPGLAAVAPEQHRKHQCDADQQQPAHQLAVMLEQLREIGGPVHPAHAIDALGLCFQQRQRIGTREVIDHHHRRHALPDRAQPQMSERHGCRRGKEGVGLQVLRSIGRAQQWLTHRRTDPCQHLRLDLGGQGRIGMLALLRGQPVADRPVATDLLARF